MCVLLVEDEPIIRDVMEEGLRDAGAVVVSVSTGEEALAIIADDRQKLSVLVTDFHMSPYINGFDVAKAFRKRWPGRPVIIASGRPDVVRSSRTQELCDMVLAKPYGPRQLVAMISQCTNGGPPSP